MDQPTFSDLEYQGKKRKTRRELFLERMDGLVPWTNVEERIRPFYPKAGRRRQPYPLSVMLRTHCVQLFYNLSDPGMEDLLYESDPVRRFVGLKLSGPLPDETTILNFRHLLEKHKLGQGLLDQINAHLESQRLRLREGTIVDATIIEAPSSTKNRAGERDPEMHQTKKGNQWHFGMKAHIGVDSDTGIVHSMSTTAANAHDVTQAHKLLHGGETVVWGDAGYQGVHKRKENLGLEVEWRVAMRPGRRRKLEPGSGEALEEKANSVSKGQGGAPLPEAEAVVRLRQGSLPGAGEEHGAAGAAVRAGQLADGRGSTDGVVRNYCGTTPVSGPHPHQVPNGPAKGETQGAEWLASKSQTAVLTPFAAPSNTTQAKTALFRGFLARWTARIGLRERTVITKTLRRRVFALVGRITHSARRLTLHLPRRWPWETQFSRALARLQAIPFPA